MPREVKIVRKAILDEFEHLIYMDDVGGNTPTNEQRLISRALAALVARRLLDCTSEQAAATVVDGNKDHGIDGIAIAETGDRLWLIQSKWSDSGRASFPQEDALKFDRGAKLLDRRKFEKFNSKVQDRAARIEAAWDNKNLQVTLVIVVMGENGVQEPTREVLGEVLDTFNRRTPGFLDYDVWDMPRIWEAVQKNYAEPAIEVTALLTEWTKGPGRHESYQGTASVADVAEWYERNGIRLFDKNIRQPLGLTRVNKEIVDTLVNAPGDFWYFNNGITVLCDSVDLREVSRSEYGPCELTLLGASVVNGAQTIAAIHEAMKKSENRAQVGRASVTLKVITTQNRSADFGTAVTKATNTQNSVEIRDFVAIDAVQRRLRQDFSVYLRKDYTYRRGEPVPTPEAGTSVLEVALALACAHSNPELAARARFNEDTLWERGPGGTYEILFLSGEPTAHQAWNAVQLLRHTRAWLAETRADRDGRASAIADYGSLLVAHLVFRQVSLDLINDENYDLAGELARIPGCAARALGWLIYRTDREIGQDSALRGAFANAEQCRTLADLALVDLQAGTPVPELPAQYQAAEPVRRPNTVTTLIDAGRILEGTKIIFRPRSARERQWVDPWLAGNPQRAEATWVNSRSKPLLWAYDGERYSPTGLTTMIWAATGWPNHPVAVQGPRQWYLEDGTSLWDLARELQDDQEADDERPSRPASGGTGVGSAGAHGDTSASGPLVAHSRGRRPSDGSRRPG